MKCKLCSGAMVQDYDEQEDVFICGSCGFKHIVEVEEDEQFCCDDCWINEPCFTN